MLKNRIFLFLFSFLPFSLFCDSTDSSTYSPKHKIMRVHEDHQTKWIELTNGSLWQVVGSRNQDCAFRTTFQDQDELIIDDSKGNVITFCNLANSECLPCTLSRYNKKGDGVIFIKSLTPDGATLRTSNETVWHIPIAELTTSRQWEAGSNNTIMISKTKTGSDTYQILHLSRLAKQLEDTIILAHPIDQ